MAVDESTRPRLPKQRALCLVEAHRRCPIFASVQVAPARRSELLDPSRRWIATTVPTVVEGPGLALPAISRPRLSRRRISSPGFLRSGRLYRLGVTALTVLAIALIVYSQLPGLRFAALSTTATASQRPASAVASATTVVPSATAAAGSQQGEVASGASATGSASPTGTPTAAPTSLPPASPPASPTSPAASTTARSQRTYVVREGDTLYAIAIRFSVSLHDLMAANGLTGSAIQPGQVLTIP